MKFQTVGVFLVLLISGVSCTWDNLHINPIPAPVGPPHTENKDTIRFFAFGDFGRDGNDGQKKLADAMEALAEMRKIDFMVCLGDNFYPDGVSSTNDSQWQTSFENIYNGSYLTTIKWYAALGNHDYFSNPLAQIEYSNYGGRWTMPDYFYTINFPMSTGSIRLVVLDTSPFEKTYYKSQDFKGKFVIDTTRQKVWMDSVFALHDTDWTIVTGHHPLYTGGLRVNDPNSVRVSLLPIFTKHSLPVYLSGHEHDLQHLKNPALPLNQFISGGGSHLRPTGSMAYTKFSASVNGFLSVEVTSSQMDLYFISHEMDTLYQTHIIK